MASWQRRAASTRGGTEELGGGAELVEVVGMLAEAERDADFFIGDGG